jgi:protein TonB
MAATSAMQVEQWKQVALHTENDRFKARYGRYIRWSVVIAFAIYIAVFWLSPQIHITPYHLPEETIEVVDIPQALDIPPPPEEIPRPQVPIEAAPDAEVEDDVEIADTLPEDFSEMAIPPQAGGGTGNDFVAFDTKPEILKWVSPVYPEFAREAGLEGLVIVNVLVGTDGRVMDAVIIQPVHDVLNKSALEAARKCLFSPGKQRNIPVPVWVALPYKFSLF